MHTRHVRFFLPLLGLVGATGAASAQHFPALGGIDVRGSAVQNPADENRPSPGAAVDLDLGSFIAPVFRPFVGGTWFATDAPASAGEGELEVRGGRAGLRLDVLGNAAVAPYVFGAVTGLQVDATVEDEDTQELLSGFNTGATAGGGIVYSLGKSHRLGISAEGSYTWINNLNHWSAGVGLRYRPFGSGAYGRRPDAPRPQVIRLEQGSSPTVDVVRIEDANPEQDSMRSELAVLRAEIARLSASQGTVQTTAASDELRERASRAEATSEELALRATRAELEAARTAAALAAAESRADSLQRESVAAQGRLAELEARTGAALLELNRITSSTTSFRETERGIVITLGDGLFPTGRTELAAAGRAEVARVAYALGHFRDRVIRVEGHTDNVGSETANQTVSERRAAAVRAAIIAEGIAPERVIAVGYGESRPAATNDTAADRARNRRVEVVISNDRP